MKDLCDLSHGSLCWVIEFLAHPKINNKIGIISYRPPPMTFYLIYFHVPGISLVGYKKKKKAY